MPLPSLNLDDRSFQDLVMEAQRRIRQSCPDWTDLSPSDPGTVLLEVFAHLTEVMIYRLNRLPDKAYREFLRLLGVKLAPPAAARAALRFTLKAPLTRAIEIPRGTRVAAAKPDAETAVPTFVTTIAALLEPGSTAVDVRAYHCDLVEGELAGRGAGLPGLSVQIQRPPIIAATRAGTTATGSDPAPAGAGFELVVGIEALQDELGGDTSARRYQDKTFRIWREVDNFAARHADDCVYVADRTAGLIIFAPALRTELDANGLGGVPEALAAIPKAGREIRIWYATGGGMTGNVPAGSLTVLKDIVPGAHLDVTNPGAATGGKAGESLENALARGPLELHSLRRAVTARDFELVAVHSSGAVNRAHAYTKAALWRHAVPGTVEVILVPEVPGGIPEQGPVTPAMLGAQETADARRDIQAALDQRRPLGTTCLSSWARYKSVQVKTRVVVHREEDPGAVKARVLRRLYDTINPLSRSPDQPGWPFGQALSAYHVYKILGGEPGVKNVEPVSLRVDEVPDADVKTLAADAFQPGTWYAGAGDRVFRSLNDGEGWEPVGRFPEEPIQLVKPYPREAGTKARHAGLLAVATRVTGDETGSRVHFSRDCGESWQADHHTGFRIQDMSWMDRDGVPTLLLATDVGLFELAGRSDSVPVQILVEPGEQKLGFYAVAVSSDIFGQTSVALAARERKGVYLSTEGGKPATYRHIGLKDEMVRVLGVQHQGPNRYLWAGLQAVGDDPGKGCFRWGLSGAAESAADWRHYGEGWQAGGCQALAFLGSTVLAASSRGGVLRLDTGAAQARWRAAEVNCGLPLRAFEGGTRKQIVMERVEYVTAEPHGRDRETEPMTLLAATRKGVYKSTDRGETYQESSRKEFSDAVTLPHTWLLCSAEHDIEVRSEDGS